MECGEEADELREVLFALEPDDLTRAVVVVFEAAVDRAHHEDQLLLEVFFSEVLAALARQERLANEFAGLRHRAVRLPLGCLDGLQAVTELADARENEILGELAVYEDLLPRALKQLENVGQVLMERVFDRVVGLEVEDD